MIKKILFFDSQALSEQVYDHYYFHRLLIEGYQVIYLDLTALYHPSLAKEVSFEGVAIHSIATTKQLKEFISNHNDRETLYVSRLTFTNVVVGLFRLFKKYNCKLAVFTRGGFPTLSKSQKLLNFNIKKYIRYTKMFFTLLLKKMCFFKTYDYIFNCGSSLYMIGVGWREDIKKAQITAVNTVDYEHIHNINKCCEGIENESYIVFLDEYYPFHPDLEVCSITPIPSEQYYSELNAFFKKMEQQFHLPVVIAAHPKAILYKEKNFFDGRQVFFGKTATLVKYCRFVLVHDSTALGFAVAEEKPMLFLNSKLIQRYMGENGQFIKFIAEYLNAPLVFYDDLQAILPTPLTDKEKYNQYKYDYLTNKDTEELSTEEIFIRTLKEL